MAKRKYPLTAAAAMGASGTRCPQIIDNPVDRRIPDKVELAEGYYILHYSQTEDGRFFKLPSGSYNWGLMGDPETSYLAPAKYVTSDLEEILRREIEEFLGSNEKPKVFTITTPGGEESLYAKYADAARGAISRAFGIPEDHLIRDGRKFIYDKKASQKPEERVYDASAWTGRKTPKPSPDLTLAEAWEELEQSIEDIFSKSALLRYLRTFFVIEYYLDDDNKLRTRRRILLAVGRKSRADIKAAIRRRNRNVRFRYNMQKIGRGFRDLSDALAFSASGLKSFNKSMKEADNG